MLGPGDAVPQARVWDTAREPLDLRDLAAGGPYLLLFYLLDWSSTWTDELLGLRDRLPDFEAAGVRAFAISRDSAWSHLAWQQALDVAEVPLLSDWNGEAVHGFGVAHEFRGLAGVAERTAFLVGGDGMIRGAWRYGTSELPDFDALVSAARSVS